MPNSHERPLKSAPGPCSRSRFPPAGAAAGAEHPLSVAELPHLHVRLVLVPHPLPHHLPPARGHTRLRHLHVRGNGAAANACSTKRGEMLSLRGVSGRNPKPLGGRGVGKVTAIPAGAGDRLPRGDGSAAVQPGRARPAGHGGHVPGTCCCFWGRFIPQAVFWGEFVQQGVSGGVGFVQCPILSIFVAQDVFWGTFMKHDMFGGIFWGRFTHQVAFWGQFPHQAIVWGQLPQEATSQGSFT